MILDFRIVLFFSIFDVDCEIRIEFCIFRFVADFADELLNASLRVIFISAESEEWFFQAIEILRRQHIHKEY